MKLSDIKESYMEKTSFNGKEIDGNDLKSALENNKNDEMSHQGSSGIKCNIMGKKLSPTEKKYQVRADNYDIDEENAIYNETDAKWNLPDEYPMT